MKKLQYCTYVLYSLKDNKLYIGYSGDLKKRLTQHFKSTSYSTSKRKPLILIFCEYYLSKKDAMRREKYFKTNPGKRALKIMLKESLKEIES